MTSGARSLFVFGIYVVIVGVTFLVVPREIVALLGLPEIAIGWGRAIGLLSIVIGIYDIVGARSESRPYLRASIFVRLGFASGIGLIVLSREMPPILLLLGAIDAACAVWTATSMRTEAAARRN